MNYAAALDAVFLSEETQIVLENGAEPPLGHSRYNELRLRNGKRSCTVPGIRELRWSVNPDDLTNCISTPHFDNETNHTGEITFPPEIWGQHSDFYGVELLLLNVTNPESATGVNSHTINFDLFGTAPPAPCFVPGASCPGPCGTYPCADPMACAATSGG